MLFRSGIPGMPPMPGLGAAHRAAGKSARKKGKKKAPRSGDPRRAAEIARGGGGQDSGGPVGSGGPGGGGLGGPGGLGGLPGGLPEGFPESLADGLANLPPGLNFPPAPPAQGNIPAAFRGGNKRKKK